MQNMKSANDITLFKAKADVAQVEIIDSATDTDQHRSNYSTVTSILGRKMQNAECSCIWEVFPPCSTLASVASRKFHGMSIYC